MASVPSQRPSGKPVNPTKELIKHTEAREITAQIVSVICQKGEVRKGFGPLQCGIKCFKAGLSGWKLDGAGKSLQHHLGLLDQQVKDLEASLRNPKFALISKLCVQMNELLSKSLTQIVMFVKISSRKKWNYLLVCTLIFLVKIFLSKQLNHIDTCGLSSQSQQLN